VKEIGPLTPPYESDDGELSGLDLGAASGATTLSVMRCISCSSRNGRGFEGFGEAHQESCPLVAVYAKPAWVSELIEAEEANAGLSNSVGASVVYAEIQYLAAFAHAIIASRHSFHKLKS
jgi:hypothetical protein